MLSPVRLHQHLRMLQFSCGGFSGGKPLVEMRLFLCGESDHILLLHVILLEFLFTSKIRHLLPTAQMKRNSPPELEMEV
jgi:hypothetical protein